MNIPFLFVFRWLIPEAKGLSRAEVAEIIEKARLASFPRIRKYSGWALVFSFVLPFLVFCSISSFILVFFQCSNVVKISLSGITSGLTFFTGMFLAAIFDILILRPAIYEYLATTDEGAERS